MSVKFEVYERPESTLESQGSVRKLVGNDGTISLIPRNYKDKEKRVVLILTKKNGTSAQITCSEAVSKGLRDKSITLANLLDFEVLEGESGTPFVSMPGAGLVTVKVSSLKAEEFVPAAISYEDLIA